MKQFKIGTIQTSYSIEHYFFIFDTEKKYSNTDFTVDETFQLEDFLASICYCDDYEIVNIDNASQEQINKYNNAIQEIVNKNIDIDDFWINNACLYANGFYETIEEMILENN